MRPRTLSASAIAAFEACPAYYKAVWIDHIPELGDKSAANLGSALHMALEEWVRDTYLNHLYPVELDPLITIFEKHFDTMFGPGQDALLVEGTGLLTDWFHNHGGFWDVEQVLSVEVKEFFPIKTPDGDLPIAYIFDRLDKIKNPERAHYRVVDYKSVRLGYNPEHVRKMIQARVYALAAQLKFKDENPIIEVQMDLLRYQPVSTIFTPDDNRKTWHRLNKIVREIYEHDSENPERRINPACRYCPIAATCEVLIENKAQGGFQVVGTDPAMAVQMVHVLDNQLKGIESLRSQVQGVVLKYAEEQDITEWDEDGYNVKVTARKQRAVDSERLSHVIGPELMHKYGRVGVTALDAMIKAGELTEEQIVNAKRLLNTEFGEPKVKVERKTPFEGTMQ